MKQHAILALGSNLGNRLHWLQAGAEALQEHSHIDVTQVASLYQTEPVDMAPHPHSTDTGWFLNTALQVETSLAPHELLQACLQIERQLGRNRGALHDSKTGYQARTLDIDILLWQNNLMIQDSQLTVPHPRLHLRAFALIPLAEIAPHWWHPLQQCSISHILQTLPHTSAVNKIAEPDWLTHPATNAPHWPNAPAYTNATALATP